MDDRSRNDDRVALYSHSPCPIYDHVVSRHAGIKHVSMTYRVRR